MNIGQLMAELGEALATIPSLSGRTFDYPPGDVTPPAGIVAYPDLVAYDATFGRGSDRVTGLVVVVAGALTDRATRQAVTGYCDGAGSESVKAALEGYPFREAHTVRVAQAEFDEYAFGGVSYVALLFEVDIVGPGSP